MNMTAATLERKKSKVKLRPLADRVVVERDEADERTAGGIVLPDKAKEKINRGKVIAVGDGKLNDEGKRVPLQVKPGDHVLFGRYVHPRRTRRATPLRRHSRHR